MSLGLQNSTKSCWKSKAQMSLGSPRVSLFFFLSCPLQPSLAFPTLVCCVCEEHCRRALGEWVVTGWSSSSLYCSLDQYWDMSGSLPGTWTGTDTPGEMSPIETSSERCQIIRILKKHSSNRQHATLHRAQLVWKLAVGSFIAQSFVL